MLVKPRGPVGMRDGVQIISVQDYKGVGRSWTYRTGC
jgi:hypothetical protein